MIDRQDSHRALEKTAAVQGGYFTAAQARQAGYNYRLQNYHVHRGNWLKIDRGLFRLPGFPIVDHEDWIRWTFWTNGKGIISHESALLLHDLGDFNPRHIHITVPPNFRKKPPEVVTLHRAVVPSKDIVEAEGYKVTTPYRCILDCANRPVDASLLAQVIRDAEKRGRVLPRELDKMEKKLTRVGARTLRLARKDAEYLA